MIRKRWIGAGVLVVIVVWWTYDDPYRCKAEGRVLSDRELIAALERDVRPTVGFEFASSCEEAYAYCFTAREDWGILLRPWDPGLTRVWITKSYPKPVRGHLASRPFLAYDFNAVYDNCGNVKTKGGGSGVTKPEVRGNARIIYEQQKADGIRK